MPGYFKNDVATAETILGDWLHTGDIGYYLEVKSFDSVRSVTVVADKAFKKTPVLKVLINGLVFRTGTCSMWTGRRS